MNERFKFIAYSAGGVFDIARSLHEGKLAWEPALADVLYACTMCNACAEECGGFWYITNEYFNAPILIKKMREHLVSEGMIPPLVRDYLKSVYLYGNPYKRPESERADWAKNSDVTIYKDQEYLFYVGCVGSYDDRGQKMARALTELLNRAGVSFGILGKEEISDGNEVDALGEFGLFQYLVEHNVELFKKKGVKKVITLSPHGYNIMKNEYPKWGADFEVMHYTQFLPQLIDAGQLTLSERDLKVTYHDPCYLGRHNSDYENARMILNSMPGVTLVEMNQNRSKAFCCGGGGGNFFTDLLGGSENSPNRIRARQAIATGADVLAVACPQCARMLEDGLKAEAMDEKIKVKDIAELVLEACD